MINHPGRPIPVPASEIPVELLVQSPEDSFPTPPTSPLNIRLSRMRKLSEDNDELEPLPHLPYPESDDVDVPVSVPLSPPDSEVEEFSVDLDWLGGSRGEMIWSGCLGGELMELDRWCGEVIDELNRDLGSWSEVIESVRTELDRF